MDGGIAEFSRNPPHEGTAIDIHVEIALPHQFIAETQSHTIAPRVATAETKAPARSDRQVQIEISVWRERNF